MNVCYYDLVASYFKNPRDVHTVPLEGEPIWFYVFVENGCIYVKPARTKIPSSKIKMPRKLAPEEFDTMIDIYHRRQRGQSVSQEAQRATQNQVYWYGVFADMSF